MLCLSSYLFLLRVRQTNGGLTSRLCHIMVQVFHTFIPLHVLLLDQPLNVLLDISHIEWAPTLCLLNNLGDQLRMCN